MTANDRAARLSHFCQSTTQDLLENFDSAFFGKGYDGERGNGLSAHGVNVTERVGRGDLAKRKGVIDNRGEEVDGLHERKSRA